MPKKKFEISIAVAISKFLSVTRTNVQDLSKIINKFQEALHNSVRLVLNCEVAVV